MGETGGLAAKKRSRRDWLVLIEYDFFDINFLESDFFEIILDKNFICGVNFNGFWMKKFWKTGFLEKKFEKKSLKELFEIKFNWYRGA